MQSAGQGFRLRADVFKSEIEQSHPVLQRMLRYIQALVTQIAQIAVCNRHHWLDQQLCRRLLLAWTVCPTATW